MSGSDRGVESVIAKLIQNISQFEDVTTCDQLSRMPGTGVLSNVTHLRPRWTLRAIGTASHGEMKWRIGWVIVLLDSVP